MQLNNQNVLLVAIVLALCTIVGIHVFFFPLFELPSHKPTKSIMMYEMLLCDSNRRRLAASSEQEKCPLNGIVTVHQGGRLGNQMWEYASVWGMARKTGLDPYVPDCLYRTLEPVFRSLTVPSFADISLCPVNLAPVKRSLRQWNDTEQSMTLPKYIALPDVALIWVQDLVQEFTFRDQYIDYSQRVLRSISNGSKECVFVGVHVRRTDYKRYILGKKNGTLADIDFYLAAMEYFEKKYYRVVFVVVSDDPAWCKKYMIADNVYVVSKWNTPAANDMAVMAACNHSIIDYGTYGTWGAILAGGETIYFRATHGNHTTSRIGDMLPGWHSL